MASLATPFGSSIGKKLVMAATGQLLFGFVVGHMLGNLQVYLGPEALNGYGEFLQELGHGGGIWVARLGLLFAVGLHIWARADAGACVVMSPHDPGIAAFYADESLLLFGDGRWLKGPTSDELGEESIGALYGVAVRELRWDGGRTFVPA